MVLVANLGWPIAALYRLKRLKSDPAEVMTASLAATVALGLLSLGVGVALSAAGWGDFGAVPAAALWLGLAAVPFQLLARLFSYVARGIDRLDIRNWSNFGQVAVRLVGLALAWALFPGDLQASLAALVIGGALVTILAGQAVLRQTGLSRRVNRAEIRESQKFGLETTAQTLAGDLHSQMDILMMGPLGLAGEQIALYAIAVGLISQLRLVPDAISVALFPRLAEEDDRAAAATTVRVCRHSMLWVVISAAGMAVIVPFLVPLLFGRSYSASLPSFFLLLPAMAMLMAYRIVARYFISRGRARVATITQLVALAVNIALNLVAIPRWGIPGAAVASVVSYGLEALIITIVFVRETGTRPLEMFVFRPGVDWPVYQRRLERLRIRFLSRRG
jgi:O-antigen/teichoic acid export membrane protein